MKLGIDLHNIRDGGGINYVSNLLTHFDSEKHGFEKIYLFGSQNVLDLMPTHPCIEKRSYLLLEKSLPYRLFFLFFCLHKELKKTECNALFSPGGLFFGSFKPFTTISRNMMPFEPRLWKQYKWGGERIRLHLLRWAHSNTFKRSNGMIFLTNIAKNVIEKSLPSKPRRVEIIAHGVNHQLFSRKNRKPLIKQLDPKKRIRLVYPSRFEPYKHQIEVIKAIYSLQKTYPMITLELCGPINKNYFNLVNEYISEIDPNRDFIQYKGYLPVSKLPDLYEEAQLLVFASSCENLPNTLIEALSFGIPIACSNIPPMPNIAEDCCYYFDPVCADSIAQSISNCLNNWDNTHKKVEKGLNLSKNYSWESCAEKTFNFIRCSID